VGFEPTTSASLHSEAAHYYVLYPKSRFVEREWKITVQIPPCPLFFATFVARYLQCKVLTKASQGSIASAIINDGIVSLSYVTPINMLHDNASNHGGSGKEAKPKG
jgi:hypothetical protein